PLPTGDWAQNCATCPENTKLRNAAPCECIEIFQLTIKTTGSVDVFDQSLFETNIGDSFAVFPWDVVVDDVRAGSLVVECYIQPEMGQTFPEGKIDEMTGIFDAKSIFLDDAFGTIIWDTTTAYSEPTAAEREALKALVSPPPSPPPPGAGTSSSSSGDDDDDNLPIIIGVAVGVAALVLTGGFLLWRRQYRRVKPNAKGNPGLPELESGAQQ
ncbi:hypothetical protein CYMTET_14156, partial [Cymbomonas tetramitiformis]